MKKILLIIAANVIAINIAISQGTAINTSGNPANAENTQGYSRAIDPDGKAVRNGRICCGSGARIEQSANRSDRLLSNVAGKRHR